MKRLAKAAITCLSALLILSSCVSSSKNPEHDQAKVIAFLQEIREIRNKSMKTELDARRLYRRLKSKLEPFKGLTEQQIRDVMGEASLECDLYGGHVAGCVQEDDIVYSFYPPCNDCLGGGVELTLSFDDHHICTDARVSISQ